MTYLRNSRILLAAWIAGALLATGGPLSAQPPPVALQTLATGLGPLSSVTNVGDERVFLTTLDGRILVWTGSEVRKKLFLDLRSVVKSGGELGLLSVAFHPDWPANLYLFVNYTDSNGDTLIERYRANEDPVRRRTARTVLRIDQPFTNHKGGQLQFGPDGFLYVGMGDGGSANDPQCNAQRGDTLLGKMLRIDIDLKAKGRFYSVPPDNPFAGGGAYLPEVWTIGMRNPWRFSFDRGTGDLFIADVGQGAREEIHRQPAASPGGENYGWAREEGSACRNEVAACPVAPPPCGSSLLTRPILEYNRTTQTCAVIGGYVYRGSAIPGLRGAYVFGDFCSGRVSAAVLNGNGSWSKFDLAPTMPGLSSFGEDAAGEIYLVSTNGVLARLVGG